MNSSRVLTSAKKCAALFQQFGGALWNMRRMLAPGAKFKNPEKKARHKAHTDPEKRKLYKDFLSAGNRQFAQQSWQEAKKAYEAALALADTLVARRKLGSTLLKLRDYSSAIRVYKDLCVSKPDSIKYIYIICNCLQKLKLLDDASVFLRQSIQNHSDDAKLYVLLGDVQQEIGQMDAARDAYQTALQLEQDDPHVLYKLGKLELDMGNETVCRILFSKAKASLRYIVAQNPSVTMLREYFIICLHDDDIAAIIDCQCEENIKKEFLYSVDNKQIYADLYQNCNYAGPIHKICAHPPSSFRNCSIRHNDVESEYFNIKDGIRRTIGVPAYFRNTVYLFGDSRTVGSLLPDDHTIASYLQRLYNRDDGEILIVNQARAGNTASTYFLDFLFCPLQKNDKLILFASRELYAENSRIAALQLFRTIREQCRKIGAQLFIFVLPYIWHIHHPSEREQYLGQRQLRRDPAINTAAHQNLAEVLYSPEYHFKGKFLDASIQRPHDMGEVFLDFSHYNHQVTERMAKEVYDVIADPPLPEDPPDNIDPHAFAKQKRDSVQYLGNRAVMKYGNNLDIRQWIDEVRNSKFSQAERIGSIVMNCNPFTWGHYHLVAHALAHVDALYIFVVNEDKSIFSFTERIRMVMEGVSAFGNRVCVVPSGKFIISSFSFPGYFVKVEAIEPADSTTDVVLFGAIIAPALAISHRFAGEEPTCVTTNKYNETMQFLLPDLGINLHIIPRKTSEGRAISASTVRQALLEGNLNLVRELVPPATYQYLMTLPHEHTDAVLQVSGG